MFAEIHVERGRIRAVLPCQDGTIIRTETRTEEYPGAHIFPGFVDNHAHLVGLGRRLEQVSLHNALSAEDCADRLRLAAHHAPEGTWLQAMGWNDELWLDKTPPTVAMLDNAVGNVPTVAMRVDGHAAWASSSARSIAMPGSGKLPDVLVDDAMMPLIAAIPQPTTDAIREMIVKAAQACVAHGITEVHDMDVDPSWIEPIRSLAESGTLPIRVQSFVRGQEYEWDTAGILPAVGEFQRTIGIKLYADGALGSRGAYLHEPYADQDSNLGIRLLTSKDMYDRVSAAINSGWKLIAIHAIGDAAVSEVLDTYQRIRDEYGYDDLILRIEHAQHTILSDIKRMADLHVIACVQPSHCLSDARMAEQRLGRERLRDAYRWHSLISHGVHIGAGSDFPIEPPSALIGIDAFVRRTATGMRDAWQGQERLSLADAVRAWTLWAHASAGTEFRRGTIAVGMDADMVVLDKDLLSINPSDILSTKVLATWTAGICRYSA